MYIFLPIFLLKKKTWKKMNSVHIVYSYLGSIPILYPVFYIGYAVW